jgi:hypothetical protein
LLTVLLMAVFTEIYAPMTGLFFSRKPADNIAAPL